MSRFYRDLHDRELLTQAASALREVQDRKLIDVLLPSDAKMVDEETEIFPRRLAQISVNEGRLRLFVEHRFFDASKRAKSGLK